MTSTINRTVTAVFLLIAASIISSCDSDFYLSESETAAYAAPFTSESGANNLIQNSILDTTSQDPNRSLRITFNNSTMPPTIQSMNLAPLLRSYTNYGLMEQFNHQINLDRLNAEMTHQVETWIQKELQLYMGDNNADVQLTSLDSVTVTVMKKPSFIFHPDRNSIEFYVAVNIEIVGTLRVDALDWFTNWISGGINGTYPIQVDIQNLGLKGEANLANSYEDASGITLNILPAPGTVVVSDGQSATSPMPQKVRDGVRDVLNYQFGRPLNQSFVQNYNYFSLSSLGISADKSLQYTYNVKPNTSRPMVHLLARGLDGKVYHIQRTEGTEGVIAAAKPFNLDVPVQSEPALIASSNDQLEAATATTYGTLAYAHYRDSTWVNQIVFSAGTTGGYKGKPALIATAPGQIMLVSATGSGNLYMLNRLNGQWGSPNIVPMIRTGISGPLRDPTAVQAGNKIVITAVDGANHLIAIVYDMESNVWGTSVILPTHLIQYAPSTVATGNGQVDSVYASSGVLYHIRFVVQAANFVSGVAASGITVNGKELQIIGLSTNASPSIACSGPQQLELVARSTDNRLYNTRYLGPWSPAGVIDGRTIYQGWQPWTDLNGNFAGSLTFELMNGFSLASTRTGKLAVEGITQPSALDKSNDQFIFHNSYDVERFGPQPWKTVLWRGYEQVGTQRFVGQPAVAVTERNGLLDYANTKAVVQGGRVSDKDTSLISSFAATSLIVEPAVDPVVVSSLPGQIDLIDIVGSGNIQHIRRTDRGTSQIYNVPMPSGVLITRQPAVVGYGNGFLDMVAVSSTGSLYHWRFRNSVWSAPVQISGTILGKPILINFGSAQLDLIALGTDRRPYFWTYSNGSWSNFWRVPTNVVVDERYFSSLSFSSWGDGSIDIGLVEYQTEALYYGRLNASQLYNGTPFGEAFKKVGGYLIDVPVITALSPFKINVLAVGTDHRVYSTLTSKVQQSQLNPLGIVWSGYLPIGNSSLLKIGGVLKFGPNELTAVGTDGSGGLETSRYNGFTWAQFQSVLSQSSVSSPVASTNYRAAATDYSN